jgi:pimeloyl-ACP methyl ester carboxylesterase
MNAVLYIHGKGGSADEAEHYKPLFPSCHVLGLDYKSFTPWETGAEITAAVKALKARYDSVVLIANSIGAFFAMYADIDDALAHAYFISPIVNMETLITDMLSLANITEAELREKSVIQTAFGEDLSWEYLSYVRSKPVKWEVPTDILYGSRDNLTSIDTIRAFAQIHRASLTILDGGEHWFHTWEQMRFLDDWIKDKAFWQTQV